MHLRSSLSQKCSPVADVVRPGGRTGRCKRRRSRQRSAILVSGPSAATTMLPRWITLLGLLIGIGALPLPVCGASGEDIDADAWLDFDPQTSHRAIADAQVRFLGNPPVEPAHHHRNMLSLEARSLAGGWVRMEQCHANLDVFPRAQIVFRRGHIRHLKIARFKHIGQAWVEDSSVQLLDIRPGAELCIEAESRSLVRNDDGTYSLHSGPFMRKFLDGYFPMRVSLTVRWPDERLQFVRVYPGSQEGVSVRARPGRLELDTWFEGRLETEVVLHPTP